MYPEHSFKLTSAFSGYKRKVQPFLKASIEKSSSSCKTEQIERLKRINELDDITSDFLVLFYLAFYVKPTKHVKLIDKQIKPTIAESQKYFLRLVPVSSKSQLLIFYLFVLVNDFSFLQTENNIQVLIDKTNQFLSENKLCLQPFLVAVGTEEKVSHFFVILNTAKYRFDSVVTAVDFCYKLHFVLNLKYSGFCLQLWMFMQKYFYKMSSKSDITCSTVTSALSDLNI